MPKRYMTDGAKKVQAASFGGYESGIEEGSYRGFQ